MNLPETVFITVELAPGNMASLSVGPWAFSCATVMNRLILGSVTQCPVY